MQASADDELVACHIDLTNAFSSLTVQATTQNTFRVQIDGREDFCLFLLAVWLAVFTFVNMYLCSVLGFILEFVRLDPVIVLQYIDDFLVVGYGKNRVRKAARTLCVALHEVGAIISIKSVLEPAPEIPWFGKLCCGVFSKKVRVAFPWLASG